MIYDGASSLLIDDGKVVTITHEQLTRFWQCPNFFFFFSLYSIRSGFWVTHMKEESQ